MQAAPKISISHALGSQAHTAISHILQSSGYILQHILNPHTVTLHNKSELAKKVLNLRIEAAENISKIVYQDAKKSKKPSQMDSRTRSSKIDSVHVSFFQSVTEATTSEGVVTYILQLPSVALKNVDTNINTKLPLDFKVNTKTSQYAPTNIFHEMVARNLYYFEYHWQLLQNAIASAQTDNIGAQKSPKIGQISDDIQIVLAGIRKNLFDDGDRLETELTHKLVRTSSSDSDLLVEMWLKSVPWRLLQDYLEKLMWVCSIN